MPEKLKYAGFNESDIEIYLRRHGRHGLSDLCDINRYVSDETLMDVGLNLHNAFTPEVAERVCREAWGKK